MYPTPSQPYGTNHGGGMGRVGPVRPSLETMARHNLWPTPKSEPSGPDYARINRPESSGDDLATAVAKMWPTPNMTDYKGASTRSPGKERPACDDDLPTRVAMWPTPDAHDYKSGKGYDHGDKRQTPQLRHLSGGSLNPNFVEWLMGYPKDWTQL